MSDIKNDKLKDRGFLEILKKLKKKFNIYDSEYIESEKLYSIFSEFFAGTLSENKKEFKIQFQADTKPEIVASTILILKDDLKIEKVMIMESFYVNKEQQFFYGDMAYFNLNKDLIESIKQKTTEDIFHLQYLDDCDTKNMFSC